MLPDSVMTKAELLTVMKRFCDDKNRGISIDLFAELAGLDPSTIRDVFQYQTLPLSEYVQRRVSKAFKSYTSGEVAIMQNRDTSKFIQYRREAKPRFSRTQRLKVVNGKIQLDIGIKHRFDYSSPNIDQQLMRNGYGRNT